MFQRVCKSIWVWRVDISMHLSLYVHCVRLASHLRYLMLPGIGSRLIVTLYWINKFINLFKNKLYINIFGQAPRQQPCLGSLGESASSLSCPPSLSTSIAVSGVTNWCSVASFTIFSVIFLFLAAVEARDLSGQTGACQQEHAVHDTSFSRHLKE